MRGGSVPTYVLGTFYIRFILYKGYDIRFYCEPLYNFIMCRTEISENEDRRSGHGTAERVRIHGGDGPRRESLHADEVGEIRTDRAAASGRGRRRGDDGDDDDDDRPPELLGRGDGGGHIFAPRTAIPPSNGWYLLNLPRNRFFEVDGVRESLRRTASDAVECIVFDAPT